MTDADPSAEIVRRFEAGLSMHDIGVSDSPYMYHLKERDWRDMEAVLRTELARRAAALQKAQDLVMALMWDDMRTAYEAARVYLINIGRVKPEECVRK